MLNVVVLTTGPLLTIDEARLHLHVDGPDEDTLIGLYADAAVLSCLNWCDLKMVPQGAEPVFKAAALLGLGDLYANRETVGEVTGAVQMSTTVGNLLSPFRNWRV